MWMGSKYVSAVESSENIDPVEDISVQSFPIWQMYAQHATLEPIYIV